VTVGRTELTGFRVPPDDDDDDEPVEMDVVVLVLGKVGKDGIPLSMLPETLGTMDPVVESMHWFLVLGVEPGGQQGFERKLEPQVLF
jgi:hypothetical protein